MNYNFKLNKDSSDRKVVDAIFHNNSYHFPKNMKGMLVVDIGAHIGTATLACVMRGAKVYAFEPDPGNFEILKKNVKKYKQVSYFPWAIGHTGIRKLHHNFENPASNVLEGLPNSVRRTDFFSYVSVVSLESIFEGMEIKFCDYLKLDCEGAEIEIVDDIIKLRDRIKNIVGELHTGSAVNLFRDKLSTYFKMEELQNHEWKLSRR